MIIEIRSNYCAVIILLSTYCGRRNIGGPERLGTVSPNLSPPMISIGPGNRAAPIHVEWPPFLRAHEQCGRWPLLANKILTFRHRDARMLAPPVADSGGIPRRLRASEEPHRYGAPVYLQNSRGNCHSFLSPKSAACADRNRLSERASQAACASAVQRTCPPRPDIREATPSTSASKSRAAGVGPARSRP